MGLWQRMRNLDHVIIAGGRHLPLDDAELQAWWNDLSPEHKVAVWNAARTQQPDDLEAVRAWVAILKARSKHERRWNPWYAILGLLTLAGLVWLTASVDDGLRFALPGIGVVVGMALGRLRLQAQLERRRADLLEWIVTTHSALETT